MPYGVRSQFGEVLKLGTVPVEDSESEARRLAATARGAVPVQLVHGHWTALPELAPQGDDEAGDAQERAQRR